MEDSTKETKKKRKLLHNYLLLVLLFLIIIIIILYFCKLYKISEEEKRKTPVISGVLSEIYSEDLEHFILDNPTTLIYICTANNDTCRTFERDFKKVLRQKEYNDQIIYLNLTDINQEEFINSFNKKYNYKTSLTTEYPAFVLFEDGEIVTILQGSEEKPLSITKVKNFLELNEIGE